MAMTTVSTTVDVDVDVDLEYYDDDELIKELKYRGYELFNKSDDNRQTEYFKDRVFNLKRDYHTLTKEQFDRELNKFFRDISDLYSPKE